MFSKLSAFEVKKKFSDRNACLQYLTELKWKDGYQCKKCEYKSNTKGYSPFARRCSDCRLDLVFLGRLKERMKNISKIGLSRRRCSVLFNIEEF